jgi:hypothetical protein
MIDKISREQGPGTLVAINRFVHRTICCLFCCCILPSVLAAQSAAPAAKAQQNQPADSSNSSATSLPRGKKLVLQDGSFQLVREYELQGDRVRYYSIDNSQWEEIPASLIDWDATKKVEAEEAQHDAALAAQVHLREQGQRAELLDVDASVEVARGIFLPPGEGLFLFDGRSIARVSQAQTSSILDKGRVLEQVLIPIPMASRHRISVAGPHSVLRIRGSQLEFYKRSTNGAMPNLQLIRAKVHSNSREFEQLYELFGQREVDAKTVPIQPWEIAPGLFRFTLSRDLTPGEYAIAEIIPGDKQEIYLWDFGFDLPGEPARKAK